MEDKPGVLADITACMKEENVSIDSFLQRGHQDNGAVSVVIMTHKAPLSAVKQAIAKVAALPCVLDKPTLMRVEEV